MGKSSIKRAVLLASACIAAVWLAACAPEAQTEEGAENMEFTVVSEDRLPEELLKIVESPTGFLSTIQIGGRLV